MLVLMIALNQIEHMVGGKSVLTQPGSPFETTPELRSTLLEQRAAREANESEKALFEKQSLSNQKRAPLEKTQEVKPARNADV